MVSRRSACRDATNSSALGARRHQELHEQRTDRLVHEVAQPRLFVARRAYQSGGDAFGHDRARIVGEVLQEVTPRRPAGVDGAQDVDQDRGRGARSCQSLEQMRARARDRVELHRTVLAQNLAVALRAQARLWSRNGA